MEEKKNCLPGFAAQWNFFNHWIWTFNQNYKIFLICNCPRTYKSGTDWSIEELWEEGYDVVC